MLGHNGVTVSAQTKQTTLSFGAPAAKRRKLSPSAAPSPQSGKQRPEIVPTDATKARQNETDRRRRVPAPLPRKVVPDSDAEDDQEEDIEELQTETQQTDIEQVLPPIKADSEAIEEYEAMRRKEGASREQRLENGEWVKGRSSIYVDAFNLALDTVLEEESHLFDSSELKLFEDWRSLDYGYQYLLVTAI